jgi:hypothetical protein
MGTISRSGITGGGTIQATHITNIIDALDGTSTTTTVIATGSFTGSLIGALTGTASFATTALSSSYAVTASYALNAGAGSGGGIFALTGSTYATTNNLQITGSLLVTAGVTASLQGTASFAVSSSRAVTASFADLSRQVLVQRTVADADHFMVIVDSDNATPAAESLNTVTNMRVNPGTDTISAVNVSGSFNVTGSMSAVKFATVDFSVIASGGGGTGQFVIPVTQTSGQPKVGSMYWDDSTATLYIYSAAASNWISIT